MTRGKGIRETTNKTAEQTALFRVTVLSEKILDLIGEALALLVIFISGCLVKLTD